MRTVHLCNSKGTILREEKFCGVSSEAHMGAYRYITKYNRNKFQVLAELWEYYHGPEGDAFLSLNKIELLLKDIEYIRPLLKDIEIADIEAAETDVQEIETFFDNLENICQKAKARNLSLKFVAD